MKIKQEIELNEPDFEALNKSVEEGIEENNEEASDAINGIPFVKALVETLDEQMIEVVKAIAYLAKKVEGIEDIIRKIGETPLPRQATINMEKGRIRVAEEAIKVYEGDIKEAEEAIKMKEEANKKADEMPPKSS